MNVQNFPLDTDSSNLAKIQLTGRYPETGEAVNTLSEMTVWVLDGSVTLKTEGLEHVLSPKSAILVKQNQPYFWESASGATLLIFSTPPWTPEQQKLI